ncbi:hypothetical protein [Glycomyces harbinensis]|uniref:Uncharacterized protein n=1 Tax=Glycomyces harbinensis TaxID=58114 RepID=A0A1G6R4I7_9ACTN|nr:hypothetical protein [Glycomyces harbinensis]SDC98917.1 hypothetical protein SAMN05216270_101261 [Glycomyces harbinensis]
MTTILKSGARRASALLAALLMTASLTGLSVLGTASAAAAEPVEVQARHCETGMSATGSGDSIRYFGWARCYNSQPAPYRFRLAWSCVGSSDIRYSNWHVADGSRIVGYCSTGVRVDIARAITSGP